MRVGWAHCGSFVFVDFLASSRSPLQKRNSTRHHTIQQHIPFDRTILHHTIRPYYTSLQYLTQHTWHHITSHNTHGITSHHTSRQTTLRGITLSHHTMHQTPIAVSMNWAPETAITHSRVLATSGYRKYQLGWSKYRQVVVSLILEREGG